MTPEQFHSRAEEILLDLDELDDTPAREQRAAVNQAWVEELAEVEEFSDPPWVIVGEDGGAVRHWLVDGKHRSLALLSKGITQTTVRAAPGTIADAYRLAWLANAGRKSERLKRQDRAAAIQNAIRRFRGVPPGQPALSTVQMAELYDVDQSYVSKLRKQMEPDQDMNSHILNADSDASSSSVFSDDRKVAGGDGKSYPATRGGLGKRVREALQHHPKKTTRQLAEMLRVSVGTVQREKERLKGIGKHTINAECATFTAHGAPPGGRSIVDGVEREDTPEVARMRAEGLIPAGHVPVVTTAAGPPAENATAATDPSFANSQNPARDYRAEAALLPLVSELAGVPLNTFLADAAFWLEIDDTRRAFANAVRQKLSKARKGMGHGNLPPAMWFVSRFIRANGPESWLKCPPVENGGCEGTGWVSYGETRDNCPSCFGHGYLREPKRT